MNKKVIGIIILVLVLIVGVVITGIYIINNEDSNNKKGNEETQVNEKVVEDAETEGAKETDKSEGEANQQEIAVGQLAPDFTLKNLEGKEVSLSDYRGKIVLVNFWATWCKYCDIEMPDLNDIDSKNEDVVVLAVNFMEETPKVKQYMEKGGYDFEVVLDNEEDKEGEITRNYLVSAFPTTYVVNKEGILMGGVPGMMTRPQMEQIIESVRAEE